MKCSWGVLKLNGYDLLWNMPPSFAPLHSEIQYCLTDAPNRLKMVALPWGIALQMQINHYFNRPKVAPQFISRILRGLTFKKRH